MNTWRAHEALTKEQPSRGKEVCDWPLTAQTRGPCQFSVRHQHFACKIVRLLGAHKTVLMMVFHSSSEVLLLANPMREHSNASQPPTLICSSQPWSL